MKLDLGEPSFVWVHVGPDLWTDLRYSLEDHIENRLLNKCWHRLRESLGTSVKLNLGDAVAGLIRDARTDR